MIAPLLPISTSVGGAAQDTGSNSNSFRLDDLQVIFESLCDLLSDVSVLPSWFASFDCDPTSADLVQPLVLYLCRCNWYVTTLIPTNCLAVFNVHELSSLIVAAWC